MTWGSVPPEPHSTARVSNLPVQEESPGLRVRASSSRDYVTEILRNAIGTRKDVGVKRVSVEVHNLK